MLWFPSLTTLQYTGPEMIDELQKVQVLKPGIKLTVLVFLFIWGIPKLHKKKYICGLVILY